MADRSERPSHHATRGPWPEVTELSQIFDHGARWCINADGHPEYDYPDSEIHVPPYECRSIGLAVDACRDLGGAAGALNLYVARQFQFGETRDSASSIGNRLVLEFSGTADDAADRISLTLGDGLRLARHVQRLIDVVDSPHRR